MAHLISKTNLTYNYHVLIKFVFFVMDSFYVISIIRFAFYNDVDFIIYKVLLKSIRILFTKIVDPLKNSPEKSIIPMKALYNTLNLRQIVKFI